jgi:uncharacterized protein (DUF2267 family)
MSHGRARHRHSVAAISWLFRGHAPWLSAACLDRGSGRRPGSFKPTDRCDVGRHTASQCHPYFALPGGAPSTDVGPELWRQAAPHRPAAGEKRTWQATAITVEQANIINRSVEKAHIWLNDLAVELQSEDQQYAYRVLRAFLHALRDHLSVDQAAQLSAQLPIFIRGIYYEGYVPSRTPEHTRDLDSFLARIAKEAVLGGETEASFAAQAASTVVRRHVSAGEGEDVLHALPAHIRELLASADSASSR